MACYECPYEGAVTKQLHYLLWFNHGVSGAASVETYLAGETADWNLSSFERFLRAILLFEVSPTELWAHCSCSIHFKILSLH